MMEKVHAFEGKREPAREDARLASPRAAAELASAATRAVADIAAEILWPTRCAVCDALDTLICDSCRESLPYIDACAACPRCGAPFGFVQCSECNPVMLEGIGQTHLPFHGAASALLLDERSRSIVSVYKDGGERRLAKEIAGIMCRYLPPAWTREGLTVSFIPASQAALIRRGFDHAELIAKEVAREAGLPCARLLTRPEAKDQRKLSRKERAENMQAAIAAERGVLMPERVLVVDDVYTTGSSLCAAAKALSKAGVREIYCLTFARA